MGYRDLTRWSNSVVEGKNIGCGLCQVELFSIFRANRLLAEAVYVKGIVALFRVTSINMRH